MLSIVVATGENGEIGCKGTMPWHVPEDLQHFKEVDDGKNHAHGAENLCISSRRIARKNAHSCNAR